MTEAETQAELALPVSGWTRTLPSPSFATSCSAAERVGIELTLVANQWIRTRRRAGCARSKSPRPGRADSAIVERVAAGDLVVTQDIRWPRWLEKKAVVLEPAASCTPRTTWPSGCRCAISWKNYAAPGSRPAPPPLGQRDRQLFAAELDRWLARRPAR